MALSAGWSFIQFQCNDVKIRVYQGNKEWRLVSSFAAKDNLGGSAERLCVPMASPCAITEKGVSFMQCLCTSKDAMQLSTL